VLSETITCSQGRVVIAALRGDIVSHAAAALAAAWAAADRCAAPAILLDFTEVCAIDDTGIALIADLIERARGRRRVLACGMRQADADIFWVVGLAAGMGIYRDQESALEDELAYRRAVLRAAV
jgi:anti-anti-sigma regulatory factor